ncbi:hypothetical protein ACJMK2_040346 [Sinanodonta woodiana]|uniref:Uncharacterized protein n=1 Tax=Sinanodonta woodiana TaxID=1069815 RepID=A0ABD3WES0_SINWO
MALQNQGRNEEVEGKEPNPDRIAIGVTHLSDVHQKLRILNFKTMIDNHPTHIDECSPTVLKYKTPNFRATTTIEMAPIQDQQVWKVGWIQSFTSWEFPELTSGKQEMVSDCDGHHYPWYGSRNETTEPNLTHITRDQSFYVWLVSLEHDRAKGVYPEKPSRWNMKLEIEIDPKKPLGQRAKLVSNSVLKQPFALEENVPTHRTDASMASRRGKPVCIIPPVWKKDVPIEKQVPKYDSKLCKL